MAENILYLHGPKLIRHYLRVGGRRASATAVEALSLVPEPRRAQHFLEKQLAPARQLARKGADLENADEALKRMLSTNHERLEKAEAVLTALRDDLPGDVRSAPPVRRFVAGGAQARGRR